MERDWKSLRKWKRLAALLLVFAMVVAGVPEMAFAERAVIRIEAAESDGQFVQVEEFNPPAGGLVREVREISREDISDDVPVYHVLDMPSIQSYALLSEAEVLSDTGEDYSNYGRLSEKQKKLYDTLEVKIKDWYKTEFSTKNYEKSDNYLGANYCELLVIESTKGTLTFDDVCDVYEAFRDDHPEYYWMPHISAGLADTLVIPLGKEYWEAEKRVALQEAIDDGVAEYWKAMQAGETDYEKVRILHDKLIDDVEYAYDSVNDEKAIPWMNSIVGVFDEHKMVVCEGYAKTMQLLLNKAEIENVYATGTGNGGPHAWNAVKLDGEWFYVDATWDDICDQEYKKIFGGVWYNYFCIPTSVFTKSHTLDKTLAKKWPKMSESENNTFFTRYNCDFRKVTSVEEAEKQLDLAGKSVPGQYIQALVSQNVNEYFMRAVGGGVYNLTAADGTPVYFVDAAKYKVTNPAVAIELAETLTINRDESKTADLKATLTGKDSGECDDAVRWSSSSSCVTIKPGVDGKSATLTAKRNGTAIITARAAKGGVEATCEVTVTGTAEYDHIYLDASCKNLPDDEDLTIWVNGGNVGATKDTKYNYKVRSLYTDIKASTIAGNGKTKAKNGKLVAGITLSPEKPILVKGKIVDTDAAKIAKATINAKTGLIKITAQKQVGEVYLWVLDTGDNQAENYAYAKITVTAAPTKILVNDANYETSGRALVKKQTLALGQSMDVYLEPLLASKGAEIAQGGSYSVTFGKNQEKYVSVEPISGLKYGYKITPVALDTTKAGKTLNVKVTFVCNENNKKATVTIVITNPMESVEYTAAGALTAKEEGENAFTVKYSETQAQELTLNFTAEATDSSFATTDKPKVYALSSENSLSVNEKGKVTVTKPSGSAAKIKASLSKDKKSIVIKVPKKLEVGTKTYFVLYYNKDCCEVFSVEVVE